MKQVFIFGAGREGRGFIADIFLEAGLRTVLADNNAELVSRLRNPGYYTLQICPPGENPYLKRIEGYHIIDADDPRVLQEIRDSQVIVLCIYPKEAGAVASLIAQAFNQGEAGMKDIMFCMNQQDSAVPFLRLLEPLLTPEALKYCRSSVGMVNTIVRRTCAYADELTIRTNYYPLLTIDSGAALLDYRFMNSIELSTDIASDTMLKLYTYNMLHCVYAFHGHLAGYELLAQAKDNPSIQQEAEAALQEVLSSQDILFGNRDVKKYCDMMQQYIVVPAMKDTIARTAFDPVRKLSRHERLTGPAHMALDRGVTPLALVRTIAAAFSYRNDDDSSSLELQELVRREGVRTAVMKTCGLLPGDVLLELIMEASLQ